MQPCSKCPEHVREDVRKFMLAKAEAKKASDMLSRQVHVVDDYDEDEDCEMLEGSSSLKSVKSMCKKPRVKGPMDFVYPF